MNKFRNMFFYKEEGTGGGEGGEGGTPPPEGGTPPPAEGGTPPAEGGAPPPASSEPIPLLDKDGNFKENWWEDYAELKDDASILQNFKTPNGLAKSLANTKRMVGKPFDPANFADETEKAEFYKKLGVPEEATGYGFEKPDDFPADREYDKTHDEWFANIAKKYNLPKEAAAGIRSEFFALQTTAQQAANVEADTQHETSMKELESEWGVEGSSTYTASLANAEKAISALDANSTRDIRADINSLGMGDSPELFRLLAMIGANVGETELAGVDTGGSGQTKDQIKAEIAKIESDPNFLIKSPAQQEMVQRRHTLRKALNNEK